MTLRLLGEFFLWTSVQWWAPIAELVFWTWYFGVLFAAYAAFHRARLAGTLRPAHWVVAAPVLLQGYPIDLAWNVLVGSVLYWERPWYETWRVWEWTFTGRCIHHVRDGGWRGAQARWWQGMLNALDPGHV